MGRKEGSGHTCSQQVLLSFPLTRSLPYALGLVWLLLFLLSQYWFRSWNRARSCYWICWWRCDNASRKGKAMTISSYSFFQSKRVKSHEANSIHSSFSSALVKWSLWFAFPCDYAFCGELLLTLHSCFRGNKNCYGWRSCDLFLLLSPVGEWVTQWKRGEEVTSQPKATLHSYDSLSQDLRFGFYAFHLC